MLGGIARETSAQELTNKRRNNEPAARTENRGLLVGGNRCLWEAITSFKSTRQPGYAGGTRHTKQLLYKIGWWKIIAGIARVMSNPLKSEVALTSRRF
jgi:hypothetical protein